MLYHALEGWREPLLIILYFKAMYIESAFMAPV